VERAAELRDGLESYKDGTSDTIVTNDRTWKYYGAGPIRYSSLDFGEVYDGSRDRDIEGWTTAGYDDSRWKKAVAVPLEGTAFIGAEIGFGGRPGTPLNDDKLSLIAQVGNNAGVFRTLTARSVKEVRPGVFVYDMGQNMTGVPRIRIADGRAGGVITLRYSEMLYPTLKESGKNT
jgi:alpha-L-rhamnosidase